MSIYTAGRCRSCAKGAPGGMMDLYHSMTPGLNRMCDTGKIAMRIKGKLGLKALSALTAFALLFGFAGLAAAPRAQALDVLGTKRYTITNPYASVNWDTWGSYKANLHTHSTVSDGEVDFRDMIEAYYAAGYDILAMTDHGTVNYGWDVKPDVDALIGAANIFKTKHALTTARKIEIYNGVGRSGRGMTEVPLGIELNGMSVKKTHINGFYANSGHHVRALDETDYEPAVAAYQQAGGITHLNHIGDWSGAADDAAVYDDPEMIDYFVDLFIGYSSCLGFELVNTSDSRTRNDRKLYDKLLQRLIPQGRTLFGFANDDSHELGDIGKSWEIFVMPSNTAANVRTAMQNGTFFAVSKHSKGELGESFSATGEAPKVTRVAVDAKFNQITLTAQNHTKIQWVANGAVIAEGATIDLNAYESAVTCYVRAQVLGPGGICYTQPFPVSSAAYNNVSVSFLKIPAVAAVTVTTASGSLIAPQGDLSYSLGAGSYLYSADSQGYIAIENRPFTIGIDEITAGSLVLSAVLDAVPRVAPKAGSGAFIDADTGFLRGLRQGLTGLDAYAAVIGSGELSVTPTANGYGTGTVVSAVRGGQVYDSVTVVIRGDADGDSFADARDAVLAMMMRNAMLEGSDAARFACDVNADGMLDEIDCQYLEMAGLFEYEVSQS